MYHIIVNYMTNTKGLLTHLGELFYTIYIIEPRHGISYNVVCATSECSDQPAHMHSLIRTFAIRLNILRVLS